MTKASGPIVRMSMHISISQLARHANESPLGQTQNTTTTNNNISYLENVLDYNLLVCCSLQSGPEGSLTQSVAVETFLGLTMK